MEVMPAQKKPLSVEDLKARMAKTGDTPFEMETITVDMDENVFLPVGVLNQLRREAVDQLIESILASYRRSRNSFTSQNEVIENYEAKQDKNGLQEFSDCEYDSHLSDAKKAVKAACYSCLIENRDTLSEILKKEWIKRIFRDQIAEAAGILEVVLSGIVLIALLMSIVPLLNLMPGLLTDADSMEVHTFLERALDIVIGIEFIKMLAKHSPGSVLEVLLYAIARHMIVGHEDAVQNLVSVGAIALIFVIRKYFFVPSFGHKMPGGGTAPDIEQQEKPQAEHTGEA
jgi:phosphate starvation-inducible membrane PsiE